MSALIDKGKIARAREARRRKRAAILDAAVHVFSTQSYGTVDLDTIGRRAGVATGIASLYFGSKEELFLHVMRRELDSWHSDLEAKLDTLEAPLDKDGLASLLAGSLSGRRTLTRMLTVLHNVMEENIEPLPVQSFLEKARDRMQATGKLIEKVCPSVAEGEGAVILRRVHVLIAGLGQTGMMSGIFAAVLMDDGMELFQVPYREELQNLIRKIIA